MITASFELSKELYELSGWTWGDTWGELSPKGHFWPRGEFKKFHTGSTERTWPAYDLGYMLWKLPNVNIVHDVKRNEWEASAPARSRTLHEWADTPEDAAAKLAIELFKQGVLE